MARPKKVGLEYFPLDCQMDDKIEMLEAEHGMEGFGVYVRLLQYCYQQEDGSLDMSIVFRWKTLGKTLGIPAENLRKMVDTMLEIDLFDKKTFEISQKLTSNGIQKRIGKVSALREKERLRKSEADSDTSNGFSSGKQDNSDRKSTQKERKVKERESKVNTTSESSSSSVAANAADATTLSSEMRTIVSQPETNPPTPSSGAPPSPELAKAPPKTLRELCLIYHTENPDKYPPEMYKAFLAHWTAPVQTGKKSEVGQELWKTEKTFNLAGRLATWHTIEQRNEQRNQPNGRKSADFLARQRAAEPAKTGYGKP